MWNCSSEEKEKIFRECKYQIIANDTFAMTLHPHNRATLLMSYLNALMEIFPQCEAVLFLPSYKMMMADKIRNCETPIKDRFIDFCINIRFFSVENTNNMIVDTLGMNTLLLPDIQYYFHEMNHQWAVAHAYSLCKHLFNNGSVLKNGATTSGFSNKGFDTELYWKCIEESSLLVPKRPVINIDTGNYAISNRPSK
ncbi:hypothetical protein AN644_00035 [Candidatus Epulonipiscium fishelsonii]|nr:hypothetical protein AN644_00035 [Epulopiscium sp. SCG-C06WGA-EpuloA1]